MKWEDAIAQFGHHYEIDPYTKTIREKLCPADTEHSFEFADIESATRALDQKIRKMAQKSVDDAQKVLGRIDTKILIARAKIGLHPRAEKILAKQAEYKKQIAEGLNVVATGLAGQQTIEALPADIRLPTLLPVGQKIYELKTNYMLEGIRISELRIQGLRIYSGWSDKKYDYSVHYDAKGQKGTGAHDFSFEYPHDDTHETELKAQYGGHIRYFLTQEAADRAATEVIARLRDNFNTVAADIRERRIERDHANTAPHYGLDL